jgi:hypothetical protein
LRERRRTHRQIAEVIYATRYNMPESTVA